MTRPSGTWTSIHTRPVTSSRALMSGQFSMPREVLPRRNFLRENAFLFATADGMRLYQGRAEPMPDDVYDSFEDIDPGFPENLCR